MKFEDLLGKFVTQIDVYPDELRFHTAEGAFILYHAQDCCETVEVEDITGDLIDLIGAPILKVEVAKSDAPNGEYGAAKDISDTGPGTWTFYKLATRKGYVDIRWGGYSNGYYSEEVDFRFEAKK